MPEASVLAEVRRAFVDTDAGQVHIRRAGSASDNTVPLLCFHQSPASSLTYQEILPYLGRNRLAIAVDTPGFGESFRPKAQPTIADYARWISDVPKAMGIERYDVMGIFTGAAIASELALQQPDRVRKVILAGPPVFTAEQQEKFVRDAWPVRPVPDGSHLMREWDRVMTRAMPEIPFERRVDAFNEFYRGGVNAIYGELAVSVYPLAETLPKLTQQVLIVKPNGIHGDSVAALELLRNGQLVPIDALGYSMMQAVPEKVASIFEPFLAE